MKCRHKANQTEHTYNKTKDTYKRNVYFVSGFPDKLTFNEKEFNKQFELI